MKNSKKDRNKHMNINIYGAVVKTDELEQFVESTNADLVKSVSLSFLTNIKSIGNTALLPVILVNRAVSETGWVERLRRAMLKGNLPEDKKEAKKVIEERIKELDTGDDVDWTFDVLERNIAEDSELVESLTNLHKQNILGIWTALEVLATDLWVAAVNKYPSNLGRAAFNKRKERMTGNIINSFLDSDFYIDMRYNFGSVAAKYFDFSGITDICRNYNNIFGHSFEDTKTLLTGNSELIKLQAVRNVLIHLNGIADDSFCSIVGDNSVLGEKISLNGNDVSNYGAVAINAGIEIMKFVDNWVVESEKS